MGGEFINCTDLELSNVIATFKGLLDLVTILVPVLLIILLMIDIIKTVSSGDVDQKKLFTKITTRISAAVIIFLIPFIIDFVIGLVPNGSSQWKDCYEAATHK